LSIVSQAVLLQEIREKLHDEFGIDHLTIQMETPAAEHSDTHHCFSGVNCFDSEVKMPMKALN
jgi:hypothetical protein